MWWDNGTDERSGRLDQLAQKIQQNSGAIVQREHVAAKGHLRTLAGTKQACLQIYIFILRNHVTSADTNSALMQPAVKPLSSPLFCCHSWFGADGSLNGIEKCVMANMLKQRVPHALHARAPYCRVFFASIFRSSRRSDLRAVEGFEQHEAVSRLPSDTWGGGGYCRQPCV